ncbi:MAG: DNA polymerase Y family protein [Candidatus Binataceae bacterium]
MRRIACILVIDFPLAALERSNPQLRGQPLALSASSAPHAEIIAISAAARAAGVRAGMAIAQARALVPDIAVQRRSAAAERSAFDALIDAADSISPLADVGDPGCVWLDISGLTRLFNHFRDADGQSIDPDKPAAISDTENAIAAELIRRARLVGLEISAGIANSKEIACLAARCRGVRVIAPGMEPDFLAWAPLDMMFDRHEYGELEAILARWGIRRLGELARLDSRAVITRLGPRAADLVRLARGESSAPFIARSRTEIFAERLELDYGVENLDGLGFVIRPMLERIVARLDLRGLIAGDIMLDLGLDDHRHNQRRVEIAASGNDVRALLTLLTLNLESTPPDAAVETITITIEPRHPRPMQGDLFTAPVPATGRLEVALARLSALCGPGQAGILRPHNSWRPEATYLESFTAPEPAPITADSRKKQVAHLMIRALRPAEEVEMMCNRDTPEFMRGKNLAARVVSIAGPWRRDGEWWNDGPGALQRDYYDIALADGGVYRTYRDLRSGRWFIDGIYD